MLGKAIAWLGMAFLIAAAYFCVDAVRDQRRNPQPLYLPVSLERGTIRAPEIKTDTAHWDHEIAVDFEAKFDAQRMECLLGCDVNPDRCKGISDLMDISWKLLDGETVDSEGNSRNTAGMIEEPGVLCGRVIGSFKARKAHRYTLVLDVNRDASELNVTHPKLVVQISKRLLGRSRDGYRLGKIDRLWIRFHWPCHDTCSLCPSHVEERSRCARLLTLRSALGKLTAVILFCSVLPKRGAFLAN